MKRKERKVITDLFVIITDGISAVYVKQHQATMIIDCNALNDK